MGYERAVDLHHLNLVLLVAGSEPLVEILVFTKSSDKKYGLDGKYMLQEP